MRLRNTKIFRVRLISHSFLLPEICKGDDLLTKMKGGTSMKHQVVINVSERDGKKTRVLKGAQLSLPQRIVRWLFGEYTQIFVMKPGETIQSVDIREMKEGVNDNEKIASSHRNYRSTD